MPLVFSSIETKKGRAGSSVNRRENTRFPLNRPNLAVSAILASPGIGLLHRAGYSRGGFFDIHQMVNCRAARDAVVILANNPYPTQTIS
jgi:hypothetical protein